MISFCRNNPHTVAAVAFIGVYIKIVGSDNLVLSIAGPVIGALGNGILAALNFYHCQESQAKFFEYSHLRFDDNLGVTLSKQNTYVKMKDVLEMRLLFLLKTGLISSPILGMATTYSLYVADDFGIVNLNPLEILVSTVVCTILTYLIAIKYFDRRDRKVLQLIQAGEIYKKLYAEEVYKSFIDNDILPFDMVEQLVGEPHAKGYVVSDLPVSYCFDVCSLELIPRSLYQLNKTYVEDLAKRLNKWASFFNENQEHIE